MRGCPVARRQARDRRGCRRHEPARGVHPADGGRPHVRACSQVADAGDGRSYLCRGVPPGDRRRGRRGPCLRAAGRVHRVLLFLRVQVLAGRRRGAGRVVEADLRAGCDRPARGRRTRAAVGGRTASRCRPERHGGDAAGGAVASGQGLSGASRLHPRHGHESRQHRERDDPQCRIWGVRQGAAHALRPRV